MKHQVRLLILALGLLLAAPSSLQAQYQTQAASGHQGAEHYAGPEAARYIAPVDLNAVYGEQDDAADPAFSTEGWKWWNRNKHKKSKDKRGRDWWNRDKGKDYCVRYSNSQLRQFAHVDGGVATIRIPDDACPVEVSFSSYALPSGDVRPFDEQVLFDNVTVKLGPGYHKLKVDLPSCGWQSDLYLGEAIQHLHRDYGHPGNLIIAWDYKEGQACESDETCTSAKKDCMLVELIEVVTGDDGAKTYRYRVTSRCKYGLSYIAFELPDGTSATAYSNSYPVHDVENPGGTGGWHNPSFRNIKFELGGDIKGGKSVELEYTLPAGATYNHGIDIRTKSGWKEIIDLHLDPSQCETDECILDNDAPEITITETATGFEVTVTDDTGLADVSFNTTNLTQTDGTLNPGDETVTYTFEINDETLGADIEVTATDECQKSSSDSASKQGICELDQGPPVINFTTDTDGGLFLNVVITDDTALEEVTYEIGGDAGSLTFVERTDVSEQEVRLQFSIDPSLNGTLYVQATDLCSNNACTDDQAPLITIAKGTELLRNGDGNLIQDPNKPGFAWQLDGRGQVTDDQGIQTLEFFIMDNVRFMFLDETGFEPAIQLQLDPPPITNVSDDFLGSTSIPFAFQGVVSPGTYRFGAMAADQCNAYVLDPAGETGGMATLNSTGSEAMFVSQAPPAMESERPVEFALQGNYPNPFNPTTTIRFDLPEQARVQLKVFDLLGREVATLVDGMIQAGAHQVSFNAADLASGTYLYRLVTPQHTFVKQMTLMK